MSIITDFSVPFDPNSETLDFSAWTDFDIKRLSKVINLTRNKVLYNQTVKNLVKMGEFESSNKKEVNNIVINNLIASADFIKKELEKFI